MLVTINGPHLKNEGPHFQKEPVDKQEEEEAIKNSHPFFAGGGGGGGGDNHLQMHTKQYPKTPKYAL